MTAKLITELVTALHATRANLTESLSTGRDRLAVLSLGGDASEQSQMSAERRGLAEDLERQSDVL